MLRVRFVEIDGIAGLFQNPKWVLFQCYGVEVPVEIKIGLNFKTLNGYYSNATVVQYKLDGVYTQFQNPKWVLFQCYFTTRRNKDV